MSNYHYGDQSGCGSDCARRNEYQQGDSPMKHDDPTSVFDYISDERSPWDKMYHEFQKYGTPIKYVDGTKNAREWNMRK